MKTKLYLIAPISDVATLFDLCAVERHVMHTASIAPAHDTVLCVVMEPSPQLHSTLTGKYLTFPDLHNQRTLLTSAHVAAFPASAGVTTQDTTYEAMHKIHSSLGMPAMHPAS